MPGEKAQMIAERSRLYIELHKQHKKMTKARDLFMAYEDKYYKLKWAFEKADRELAMIDGRYKVIPSPDAVKKKSAKPAQLSTDQIMEIAERLGIDVLEDEEGGSEDTF